MGVIIENNEKHPDALVMRMWVGNVLNVHENVTHKKTWGLKIEFLFFRDNIILKNTLILG